MFAIKIISRFARQVMNILKHNNRLGFTIVELMIAVSIIALLAAVAVPAFARSRKRAQATRVLEDIRMLDHAMDRWAIENNKAVGDIAMFSDIKPYFKTGGKLSGGVDVFGNSFGTTFTVDTLPRIPAATFNSLSDVAPAEFWSPYN